MQGGDLALQTQLLLQEATQVKQRGSIQNAINEIVFNVTPISEYETAKQSLVAKLQKKELNRKPFQKNYHERFGMKRDKESSPTEAPTSQVTTAQKKLKLPVVFGHPQSFTQQKSLLAKLKSKAINQQSEGLAKYLGYSSYEEQITKLNEFDRDLLLKNAQSNTITLSTEQNAETQYDSEQSQHDDINNEINTSESTVDENDENKENKEEHESTKSMPPVIDTVSSLVNVSESSFESSEENLSRIPIEPKRKSRLDAHNPFAGSISSTKQVSTPLQQKHIEIKASLSVSNNNEDGHDADIEQDSDLENEKDDTEIFFDSMHLDKHKTVTSSSDTPQTKHSKDKAASFRQLLADEALAARRRKRLMKNGGNGKSYIESEAEEEEEEDVLQIGGLGDFGFGVPQAKTQQTIEAEEERNALKIRADDLEGIVDDLSDDEEERAQQADLSALFRKEMEQQDRAHVKEVMRNVKEGFGRNRRAFSSFGGTEARGRFNLNELVAADGKLEAARLGLLESDEEVSDDDGSANKDARKGDDEHDETASENVDIDEEAEMEQKLRERFLNQPQIYLTSSESESEDEADLIRTKSNTTENEDEAESDEERERKHMSLFSERARINRRLQRMKNLQNATTKTKNKNNFAMNSKSNANLSYSNSSSLNADDEELSLSTLPRSLMEDDEDSQELMSALIRTDIASTTTKVNKPNSEVSKLSLLRFQSLNTLSTAPSHSSSFKRVAKNCKLFTTGGGSTSKSFVFTTHTSAEGQNLDPDKTTMSSKNKFAKRKRDSQKIANIGRKKVKNHSDFLSALVSYDSFSQNSAPF